MTKPYSEQTAEERVASIDKALNVVVHPDWRELYLRFSDERNDMQRQMDEAPNWETFVAARAVKLYIQDRLLNLRERLHAEKADLEEGAVERPLPPTDYEAE